MVRALLFVMVVLLSGCAGPTRGVTLRVTTLDGDPVERAHVFAIVLGRSPAPLPVTLETLEEAATEEAAIGWTDEAGEVFLVLDADQAHLLMLRPPALGPHSAGAGEAGAYRFLLEPGSDVVRPDPVVGGEVSELVVRAVR